MSNKPKLVMNRCNGNDTDAQCYVCLSRDNIYEFKGDRLSVLTSLCKDCILDIYKTMIFDVNK